MSLALWDRLTPQERDIFERGEAVWEQAMVVQLNHALTLGQDYARAEGLEQIALSAQDQAAFDALYQKNAVRLAEQVRRFGIDGVPIAQRAAALVAAGDQGCRQGSGQ
jgi:hypothetical protein